MNISPRGLARPSLAFVTGHALAQLPPVTDRSVLFVDLALGPVRPNDVAVQLCRQLGLPAGAETCALGTGAVALGDMIGTMIDNENLGFAPLVAALRYADRILPVLAAAARPTRIVVLTPQEGSRLGGENELLLQLLAEQGAGRVEIVAFGPREVSLDSAWVCEVTAAVGGAEPPSRSANLWDRVPGPLAEAELARLGCADPAAAGLIALPDGCWLVPPEFRQRAKVLTTEEWTAIAAAPDRWLAAYALRHLRRSTDFPELLRLGWAAIAEGSDVVGLACFLGAQAAAQGTTAVQIESMILGVRISLEDFATVAQAPEPDPALPPRLRGQLLQHKAWGYAMSGRPREALPIFAQALDLLRSGDRRLSREFLYLLNITALTFYRAGDFVRAMQLEKEMTAGVERLGKPDVHLDYINSINLARLYLSTQDLANAEAHFDRAFRSHDGVRTLVDHLTLHVYRARLAEARQDEPRARRHWLRAALYWAASDAPDTISARVARLLLGNRLPARRTWTDAISEMFVRCLTELHPDMAVDDAPPIFGSAERCQPAPGARVVASADATVVAVSFDARPGYDSPVHRRLRALLRAILAADDRTGIVAGATHLVVDDQFGRDLPDTPAAALALGARWSAAQVFFAGECIGGSDTDMPRVPPLCATIAPAVLRLATDDAPPMVYFRRYRAPRRLLAEEAALLTRLTNQSAGAEGAIFGADDAALRLLRRLEQERVVVLSWPSGALEGRTSVSALAWAS